MDIREIFMNILVPFKFIRKQIIYLFCFILFVIVTLGLVYLIMLYGMISPRNFNKDVIVNTDKGRICGKVLKSEMNRNYYAFQEIPYASPPVGDLRFQEPKEHKKWTGVLDTGKNSKICFQPSNPDPFYKKMDRNENCLFLNVYTPTEPESEQLLPVLFWIHSGTFTDNSGAYLGPKFLMDFGIVIVTINYRLGPFGFMGTDDGVIPLNLGLKDQRFAMKWVNRNIHHFGGDPKQVTIAGQSFGSISVGYHLLGNWAPNETVLFHGAILHSGNTISGLGTQQNATKNAFDNGKSLDPSFSSNSTHELLELLKKANAKDILQKCSKTGFALETEGPFSYPGYQSFMDGMYKKIPVMIGFTSEEMVNFVTKKNTPDTLLQQYDNNSDLLLSELNIMLPYHRKTAGKLLKNIYTNTSFVNYFGGYVQWLSDHLYTTSICRQVELASVYSPYYFYQFSYKGKLGKFMNTVIPEGAERVGHAEDIMYLWDAGWTTDLSNYPEEDRLMAKRFIKLWTNFIKYFNPTPKLGQLSWQPSEPVNLRYMNLNATLEMRQHPRQYELIRIILEEFVGPPFVVFS